MPIKDIDERNKLITAAYIAMDIISTHLLDSGGEHLTKIEKQLAEDALENMNQLYNTLEGNQYLPDEMIAEDDEETE